MNIHMIPYNPDNWTSFFSTAAGAAATLAGLVIVAISVNIQEILKYRHLPSRAAATIYTLVLIVVSCMAGLMHQGVPAFGAELFFFGLAAWLVQLRWTLQKFSVQTEFRRPLWETILVGSIGQAQTLPFVIAGILLFRNNGSGIYWMAAGVIATFIFSILNVWVLLVEILR